MRNNMLISDKDKPALEDWLEAELTNAGAQVEKDFYLLPDTQEQMLQFGLVKLANNDKSLRLTIKGRKYLQGMFRNGPQEA